MGRFYMTDIAMNGTIISALSDSKCIAIKAIEMEMATKKVPSIHALAIMREET
jgi:hypothetical protein